MHARKRLAMVAALVLGAALLTPATAGSAASKDSVTQRTVSQIEALSKAKLARTATERKVDSRLLAEIAMRSGSPVAAGLKKVQTGVAVTAGKVSVDVQGAITTDLLNRVRAAGGSVQNSQLKAGTAQVTLPLDKVLATAALPQVARIAPSYGSMTMSMTGPGAPKSLVAAVAMGSLGSML
jgi:hypothetical protein